MNPITAIEKWIEAGMPMTVRVRLGILVLVLGFIFGVFAYFLENEKPVTPCSPEGTPGSCYYVTQDMCNTIWSKATAECTDYIKSLSLAPGRLTGPIELKCKLAKFDQVFRANRKSEPICESMISDVEDWRRRNDFDASTKN